MRELIPVITIDGPSGTGKGTVCRLIAQHLSWHMLDSGALYRVLAWDAHLNGVDLDDEPSLASLALSLDVNFKPEGDGQAILLKDSNVTDEVRTPFCASMASKISVLPTVRAALLDRQRSFATAPGLVTDGRDMGTVVFPGAVLKLFLDASIEERANRRYLQLINKGIGASLARVVEEMTNRDLRDRNRAIAPLIAASDAMIIDTSCKTIGQVMDCVLHLIHEQVDTEVLGN